MRVMHVSLPLRLNSEDLAKIQFCARRADVHTSTWIRNAGLATIAERRRVYFKPMAKRPLPVWGVRMEKQISVRFDESQYTLVLRAAARCRVPPSTWVRAAALEQVHAVKLPVAKKKKAS